MEKNIHLVEGMDGMRIPSTGELQRTYRNAHKKKSEAENTRQNTTVPGNKNFLTTIVLLLPSLSPYPSSNSDLTPKEKKSAYQVGEEGEKGISGEKREIRRKDHVPTLPICKFLSATSLIRGGKVVVPLRTYGHLINKWTLTF